MVYISDELYKQLWEEANVKKLYDIPSELTGMWNYNTFLYSTKTVMQWLNYVDEIMLDDDHWLENGTMHMWRTIADHLDRVHFPERVYGEFSEVTGGFLD